jgi:hypothetical protein
VTLLLTDHALANVDPKFLTGHITVGMESIADAQRYRAGFCGDGVAVGNGDVLVYGYRGVDDFVGERAGGDARGP